MAWDNIIWVLLGKKVFMKVRYPDRILRLTWAYRPLNWHALSIPTISPIVAIDPPTSIPTPTFQSDKKVAKTISNPHSGLLTNAGCKKCLFVNKIIIDNRDEN